MISKLTRLRLLAVLCGPLLGIATGVALGCATSLTLYFLPDTEAAIWEPIAHVLAWIPVTLCVAGLCLLLGPYDLLAVVTCVIPALLYFAITYQASIFFFLPDDGHTMYTILGSIPPFDYKDQVLYLFKLLLWALSAAAVGIALKRWISHWRKTPHTVLSRGQRRPLWRGIAVDIGFFMLVIVVLLALDLRSQVRLGSADAFNSNPAATPD